MSGDGGGEAKQATAEELKNGIQRLLELQGFALDRVKTLGMTRQEIDTIDRYRKEISVLVEQVASLLEEKRYIRCHAK
jgi:hypothetical protein